MKTDDLRNADYYQEAFFSILAMSMNKIGCNIVENIKSDSMRIIWKYLCIQIIIQWQINYAEELDYCTKMVCILFIYMIILFYFISKFTFLKDIVLF